MKYKLSWVCFLSCFILISCEQPSSPDFVTQQSFDIPLIKSATYKLMGEGSGAIIDTTSEDYENLFSVDDDGLISLSSEAEFGIGNFSDMSPSIDVDPTDVESEIGVIDVSFTGGGTATYEDITGVPANNAPGPGLNITAGQSPDVDIELNVSDFDNGVIESGAIVVAFTNQLGFDISELEATLISGGAALSGPEQLSDINTGEQKEVIFQFQQGDVVSVPMTIRINVEWDAQTVKDEPGDLFGDANDDNLLAQNVTAVLDSQEFFSDGTVEIDDQEFRFVLPTHYAEIQEGMITIDEIVNHIDMDIDTLIISFPDIRMDYNGNGSYELSDSLWFAFTGNDRIRRSSDLGIVQPEIQQSLVDARIYAPDNMVIYNVRAVTENSRLALGADTVRTVGSTDRFITSVAINDLVIKTAFGEVQSRIELLNEDDAEDGVLDLYNDLEAEITSVEDLEVLSEKLSGIRLYNASFDLLYNTNLGVKGKVIAAIAGINDNGEAVYLSGKSGSDKAVVAGDDYANLYANGSQIDPADLISFDIEPSETMGEIARNLVVSFDTESSNVDEFLSNLPTEIRFIGKVMVNPDGEEGFVVEPVEFNTSMGMDIPINLSTAVGEPASFENTSTSDLSNLPSSEDDLQLMEMTLSIAYDNGLPFETGLSLQFLDEFEEPITTAAGTPISMVNFNLDAAKVDLDTRFVNQSQNGISEIKLTGEQLENMSRTRFIRLIGDLATSRDDISGEVKLRSDDFISLSISASIQTSIRVN